MFEQMFHISPGIRARLLRYTHEYGLVDYVFYRTPNSRKPAALQDTSMLSFPVSVPSYPTTSRAYYKTPLSSDIQAGLSEIFCLLLSTQHSVLCPVFFPRRNNSPSTAAAPLPAAAITPVYCAKSAFFALLPQLSSAQQKSEPISRITFVFVIYTALWTLFSGLSFPQYSELRTQHWFPSANLVARLAALRHKTHFSATKSANASRVVAVSVTSASAAAIKKRTRFKTHFLYVFTLDSVLCTLDYAHFVANITGKIGDGSPFRRRHQILFYTLPFSCLYSELSTLYSALPLSDILL
jgi:hypothetical protein